MLKSIFSELGLLVSKKQLDTSALRQKVISNNVANVNTPGFKRSDVSFETNLEKAMNKDGDIELRTTDERHFKSGASAGLVSDLKPSVVLDSSSSMRGDENNVDIDKEMVGLAKNQIMYESFTRMLAAKYRALSSVISEGRR